MPEFSNSGSSKLRRTALTYILAWKAISIFHAIKTGKPVACNLCWLDRSIGIEGGLESQIQAQGLIHYKHFSLLRYFGRRLSFRTRILPNFHWLKYFNKLAMYNYWYSTEWTNIYCANLYSVEHAKKGGGGGHGKFVFVCLCNICYTFLKLKFY